MGEWRAAVHLWIRGACHPMRAVRREWGARLPIHLLRRDAATVARELLGCYLVRRFRERFLVVKIVEAEAYLGACDRASHAWNDRHTARTANLFRAGGVAYVYFIYGMYHCLNVVTGSAEDGSAVLVRAAAPIEGAGEMAKSRGLSGAPRPGDIAGGPGKLCQALRIGLEFNGQRFDRGSLTLHAGEEVADCDVAIGPRVGVRYAGEAAEWPLRFALAGDPHVSRPRL